MNRIIKLALKKKAAGYTVSNRGNINTSIMPNIPTTSTPNEPLIPKITPARTGNMKAVSSSISSTKPFAPDPTPPTPTIQAASNNVPQYSIPPVR